MCVSCWIRKITTTYASMSIWAVGKGWVKDKLINASKKSSGRMKVKSG